MKRCYKIAGASVVIPAAAFAAGYAASNLYAPSCFRQSKEIKSLENENAALAGQLADIENKWKDVEQNEALSLPDDALRVKNGTVQRRPLLDFGTFQYDSEELKAVLVSSDGKKEYRFKFTNFDSVDQYECIASYIAMVMGAHGIQLKQNAKHFPRTRAQREQGGMQTIPVEVEYFKDEHGVPTGIKEIICDAKQFVKFVPWVAGPEFYPSNRFEQALGGIAGQVPLDGLSPENQESTRRWMRRYHDKLSMQEKGVIGGVSEWSETMRNYMKKRTEDLFHGRLKEQVDTLRPDAPD